MKKRMLMLCCVLNLLCAGAIAQKTQLPWWYAPPLLIDMQNFQTYNVGYASGPTTTAGTTGYNLWHNGGNLRFWVANTPNGFEVMGNGGGSYGQLAGGASAYGEVGLIPHTANFTNPCQSRFWIVYNTCSGSGNGWITASLVDMNTNSIVQNVFLSISWRPNVPFAISKIDANGDRYMYLGQTDNSSTSMTVWKINSSGFSLHATTGIGTAGNEMELTNAGNKLAYVAPSGNIQIININPTTHQPSGSATTVTASAVAGLEFDDTGNKLYYSASGGVRVYNISTTANTSISGSSSYATGMLEKSHNVNGTYQIICGNSTSLSGINPTTNALAGWTSTIAGLVMPDQVDGEYLDGELFKITPPYPYKHACTPYTFTATFAVHPNILTAFSSLYTVKTQVIGNAWGPWPPASWYNYSFPSITSGSVSFPISSTTSFRIFIYPTANPSCSTWFSARTFSLYITPCFVIGWNDPNIGTSPDGFMSITSQPGFPDEERDLPGFGNSWAVQELDPESGEPLYNIEDADCWHTEPGQEMVWQGFDAVNTDYIADPNAFDCTVNSEGEFDPDRVYRLVRTVWADEMDPTIFDNIINTGEAEMRKPVDKDPLAHVMTPVHNGARVTATSAAPVQKRNSMRAEIYPNPSAGRVEVKTKLAQAGTLEVYNINGSRVYTTAVGVSERVSTLDLSSLGAGLYVVQIRSGSELFTQKLMLK